MGGFLKRDENRADSNPLIFYLLLLEILLENLLVILSLEKGRMIEPIHSAGNIINCTAPLSAGGANQNTNQKRSL